MVHQHSWNPGLCAHSPLGGAEALHIWSIVDLRYHVVQGLDDALSVWHVRVMIWLLAAVCKEHFDTPSEYLVPSFHNAQPGVCLAG